MPADIVTLEDCASNYGVFLVWGSKGGLYTVTFHGSEGQAHCTCKAWMYAPEDNKHCKHVQRVWDGACMYNPQWRDGKAEPEFKPAEYTYRQFSPTPCPACGGKMVYVRRAV